MIFEKLFSDRYTLGDRYMKVNLTVNIWGMIFRKLFTIKAFAEPTTRIRPTANDKNQN